MAFIDIMYNEEDYQWIFENVWNIRHESLNYRFLINHIRWKRQLHVFVENVNSSENICVQQWMVHVLTMETGMIEKIYKPSMH